jgi:hypothetical protein
VIRFLVENKTIIDKKRDYDGRRHEKGIKKAEKSKLK